MAHFHTEHCGKNIKDTYYALMAEYNEYIATFDQDLKKWIFYNKFDTYVEWWQKTEDQIDILSLIEDKIKKIADETLYGEIKN